MADIDLVVVNYKTYNLIDNFISSYRKFKPKKHDSRLILIDNESDPVELDHLDKDGLDEVVSLVSNIGYSGACNYGASLGDSDYVAFLNSDTEFVDDKCVDYCVDFMESHLDVAVVGPLQYSSDGVITAGGIFGTHDAPFQRGWKSKNLKQCRDTKEAVTVSGSAFFLRRSVWDEMQECEIYRSCFPLASGGLPPFPHFYEETLYCYHVFAHGYKCFYLGEGEMIHQWHQSSPVGSQNENFEVGRKGFREFCDKHGISRD